jgi:hypothetical protein
MAVQHVFLNEVLALFVLILFHSHPITALKIDDANSKLAMSASGRFLPVATGWFRPKAAGRYMIADSLRTKPEDSRRPLHAFAC